jgi:nicotinamide riboside transporter PnuC
VFRLDYLSCILTIASTILIGKRYWAGWLLAGVNSVIICVIGLRTSQYGLIPANVFCILLYGINLRTWRAEAPAHEEARPRPAKLLTEP